MKSECYKIISPLVILSNIHIFLLLFDLRSVYLYHIHTHIHGVTRLILFFNAISKVQIYPRIDGQSPRAYTRFSFISIKVYMSVHSPLLISSLSSPSSLHICYVSTEKQVRSSIHNYFDKKKRKSSALMLSFIRRNYSSCCLCNQTKQNYRELYSRRRKRKLSQ